MALHRPQQRDGKNHQPNIIHALDDVFNFCDLPMDTILPWISVLWEVGTTPEALIVLFIVWGASGGFCQLLKRPIQLCTQKNNKTGTPRYRLQSKLNLQLKVQFAVLISRPQYYSQCPGIR